MGEGEQHQAQPEKDREHETQGTVVLDAGGAGNVEHEESGDPASDQGAKHQNQRLARPRDQEGKHDPGQRGVRDRIPQQALFAQYGKGAEHATDDAEDRGSHGYGAKRVIKEEVVKELKDVHRVQIE